MKVSYNEVTTLCQKVFEGLGFTVGDYEDAGEIISWLALHGIDGLSILEKELSQQSIQPNQQASHVWEDESLLIVDLQGTSSLLTGSMPLELGYTKAQDTDLVTVKLRHCQHPIWLLPYLVRCGSRGINIFALWHEEQPIAQEQIVVIKANDSYPTVHTQSKSDPSVKSATQPEATIFFAKAFSLLPAFSPKAAVSLLNPEWFQEQKGDHTQHGIEVDPKIWQTLQALAKNVLVEATEASRQRGAGENAN